MENDTVAREFDFKTCPWCRCVFKDSEIAHVCSDRIDINHLIIRCDSCGMIYSAERKTTWLAKRIREARSPQKRINENGAEE
jgi:uncharacterized protein with PIN domain